MQTVTITNRKGKRTYKFSDSLSAYYFASKIKREHKTWLVSLSW